MPMDLSPLLRGALGDTIRIAGVAVGDRAANVDRAALSAAEDSICSRITADPTSISTRSRWTSCERTA